MNRVYNESAIGMEGMVSRAPLLLDTRQQTYVA